MSTDPPASAGKVKRAQPETFRARSVTPALTVKDVQASLTWYTDVAGFVVDEKYEHEGELMGVALKAGSERIFINQDDGSRGWDRVKGEGFSLHFTTVQDVDEIARRIKDRGGTLESDPADLPWGGRAFRVRDPDGFALVITSGE